MQMRFVILSLLNKYHDDDDIRIGRKIVIILSKDPITP